MKKLPLVLLLNSFVFCVYAVEPGDSCYHEEVHVPVNTIYLGDYLGTKPGVNLSIENVLRKVVIHKKNGKICTKSLYNPYNVGWYNHKGYNSALYLTSGLGIRKQRESGFFTGGQLGLGLMRTFTPGPTYVVNETGISEVTGGYFYANGQIFFEIGKRFQMKDFHFSSFAQLGGMAQFPYNNGVLFHLMAGIGIRHELGWTKNVKVVTKYKNRTK